MHIVFWWGNVKEREYFEDLVIDRRIILKWIIGNVVDWADLAQDSDRWRAAVDILTDVWVPENSESFLTS